MSASPAVPDAVTTALARAGLFLQHLRALELAESLTAIATHPMLNDRQRQTVADLLRDVESDGQRIWEQFSPEDRQRLAGEE